MNGGSVLQIVLQMMTAPVDAVRLWWFTAGGLALILICTAGYALLDGRTIGQDGVWTKPMKFQVSLALHFATLALIADRFSDPWRTGQVLLIVAIASVAATIFEIGYIMLQAARQQPSHFNLSTPLHAALYALMAAGAVVIVAAAGAVGTIAMLDGDIRLGPAVRTGVVLGLIGGAVLTTIVAFTMGGRLDHHVGIATANGPRIPLTGWSREVGDLRAPHFFATHMMQAVPLAALVGERALGAVAGATAAVWIFALLWTWLTLWLYRGALAGIPLGA